MKALAVVYAVLAPLVCFAGSAVIHIQNDFDLQLIATGEWNPVTIDWDAKGRMWLAVTAEDPLGRRSGSQRDRILMAHEDGLAAHWTELASRLGRIGGFVFHRDGVITAEGSRIVFIGSNQRETIFSGLGTDDEPARLSSLRTGIDGWIYAVLGEGAERCNNIVGQRAFGKIDGGVVRFKADGSAIETYAQFESDGGSVDLTWDHEIFASLAEGPHASHVGMPERCFSTPGISNATSLRKIEDHRMLFVSNPERERFIQISPGTAFTRPTGAMIYEGGAWPERYHGNYYVCDPDLRVIHEDVISRAESAYFEGTRRMDEEFASARMAPFRPHELRFGPDGAMYVLVSGGTAERRNAFGSGRSPLRSGDEQPRGAIWRIQHKQPRRVATPNLAAAAPGELVRALEHQNGWVRRTALRLLLEGGSNEPVRELEQLATASRFAHARVSALWVLHHLNELSETVWTNALQDAHTSVQRNAWLTFVESDAPVAPAIEKIVNKQYKDADQRVKLSMLLALAKGPLTEGGRETTVKLFPDLKDVWSKSVVLTIAREAPMEAIKLAFASDKSENYRELVVPLVRQLSPKESAIARVMDLTTKHEKAEKLTAAVKEVIAKQQR